MARIHFQPETILYQVYELKFSWNNYIVKYGSQAKKFGGGEGKEENA